MNEYLESIKKRDPAAKSILSIILTYPGVKAVLLHRIAKRLIVFWVTVIDKFLKKNLE